MKNIGRHIARGAAVLVVVGLIPLVTATPALAARQKTIRISDASIVEGDAGQKTMSFTVSWTGAKGGAAPSVELCDGERDGDVRRGLHRGIGHRFPREQWMPVRNRERPYPR